MLRPAALALLTASCAKPVPVENMRSQVGAGLMVAAPIARIIAKEVDTTDGAVGCIVGETLAEAFDAAGRQLATGQHDPDAAVYVCDCLALRDDWQTIDIPAEMAQQAASAVEAISLLVGPYIRDCEAHAWFGAATQAVAMLVEPMAEALSLDACSVPVPPIVPDLEVCSE